MKRKMPALDTQSYMNSGANVRARASELASDPVVRSKAGKRFMSRRPYGDVAERAAVALMTEAVDGGAFDPALLFSRTDAERAAARINKLGRRDKRARLVLIGLLRVVGSWARVVLGRDEACAAVALMWMAL